MKVDLTKSVKANMVDLLNERALLKYKFNEVSFSNPAAITPSGGNGNNNTAVTVTVPGGGTLTLYYTRLGLVNHRPRAGNKIFVTSSDTHETITAKILAYHQLLEGQVGVNPPATLPAPNGGTANYFLNVITNSYLYSPSNITIIAQNQSST